MENGTIITPLLLFYLNLGLVCEKIYCIVQYTPVKCFNNFVQSALNARIEVDENSKSSVVAETMILLANSFFAYQIMDRSRHTVAKYIRVEKTLGDINYKMLDRVGYKNDQLYEVELIKSEVQRKEPIVVGFFIHKQNWEFWSYFVTSLTRIATLQCLKSWRWTPIRSI